MTYGINLYNQNGKVVTHGVNEEMFYWGQATFNITGGIYLPDQTHYALMNIPEDVPFVAFMAYNSFPAEDPLFSFYTATMHGDGSINPPDTNLTVVRHSRPTFPAYSVTFYIFVPFRYIPALEETGIFVYSGVTKLWSTERPMLKVSGFRKQEGSSCALVAGIPPNRPAMISGWGSPVNNMRYNGVYHGSVLTREWSPISSYVSAYFKSNVSFLKPMIDRDYYDRFSNIGNWYN